jgi:hypothetical protein
MYDPKEFTERRGVLRGTFGTYRRNGSGGMDLVITIIPEDRHMALDIVDGGDIVNLITVDAMPEEEWDFDDDE